MTEDEFFEWFRCFYYYFTIAGQCEYEKFCCYGKLCNYFRTFKKVK